MNGGTFHSDASGGTDSQIPGLRRVAWSVNKPKATPEGKLVPEATMSGDMGDPQHRQTVPRGGLRAVVELVENVPPDKPLYIGCDNKNTVDGTKHPRSEKWANVDLWRRYWKAVRARTAAIEVYKVDARVDEITLWAGTIPYHDYAGNTYADAYAKAMALRVQAHGAQRALWRLTYKLGFQVMTRLLIAAQRAITADQRELHKTLRRKAKEKRARTA